jgi:putative DNA primase/helicase
MLDFNDPLPVRAASVERDALRASLLAQLPSVLTYLLPAGKRRRHTFSIGDVLGSPGDSLEIVLEGEKAGLWTDRATGEGGDVFALLAAHWGMDAERDFQRLLDAIAQLIGTVPALPPLKKPAAVDHLGPATAKWDYRDTTSQLLAVVYRYDPPGGDKEFRPWDAKRRKMTPPEPRPLYNQSGIALADQVILVEGEKCAQALIDAGWCATTAMQGAHAPVDKTDWKPLLGKAVLVWPDKDKPGWAYAQAVSEAISAAGALSVSILLPPNEKPEGWDVADALAEGYDVMNLLTYGERIAAYTPEIDPILPNAPENSSGHTPAKSVWGSDDALALAFTLQYGKDWKYVAAWGQWLVWTGPRWQPETTLRASDLIRGLCRRFALSCDSARMASRLASSGTVTGVERLARADRRHAANTDVWDAEPWRLNTANGIVDLRTGTLSAHARDDHMTKVAQANWPVSRASACPTWHQFLIECTGGDAALQAYLQRICGYCLTGSTQEHALFFLYGTGANGKSVFVNTLCAILADYATNAPMTMFMETRSDSHPTDLASLRGARLVASVETEQGRRWNESKIKALTGGDKVSARFMRQDFFQYTPQFKLLIAGNHKPSIRNLDEAMRRRLQLIPFTVTVPPERRDKQLEQKIWQERDAVLAWMVEGCQAWQRIGLSPPNMVREATDEYFESEDAMGRWLTERCLLGTTAKSLTCELFADWKEWAETNGEFQGSQRRFSDALLTRRIDKWRNNVGARGFSGIGLKEARPPATPHRAYAD